jgi:nucleoside-diphosphate-sugar epimerase
MQKKWGVVGCGWLGLPLAEELVSEGESVIGTTSSQEKIEQLREYSIQPELMTQDDFYQPKEWLKTLEILVLNIPPSSFGDEYSNAMASIVKQLNKECKVIFISSTSVYPNCNGEVNEQTSTSGQQRNGPVVSKAEKKLEEILGDRLTILRMAGLVGGSRNPVKFLSGRTISGANAPVNLVHRKDCIGIIQKVQKTNFWGQKLNVCVSEHPTKESYYSKAAKDAGLEQPKFKDEKVDFKIIDNNSSREKLGYTYLYDSPFDFPDVK